jgi:anti-anti-sigma factor
MSTDPVELGFSGLAAPAGAHIGYPYVSENERYENLLGFIATGLDHNEKCVAAVSEYTPHFWVNGLRANGLDPNALPKGQLEIITAGQFARNTIAESVQTAIHMLGDSLESASGQGWNGARACTSFVHLFHHRQAVSDLLATEMEINDVSRDGSSVVLCTLSKTVMHPEILNTVLSAHPFITDGSAIHPNDDYVTPMQLAPGLPDILNRLECAGAFVPPCAQLDFLDDTPVIRTCQEMDFYTSPKLEELANMVIGLSHRHMVVDLSSTDYLDASTIGVLVRIARVLEKKGGRLALFDPRDPIRKIFRIVNLDDYIPIHRSLEAAMDSGRISAAA